MQSFAIQKDGNSENKYWSLFVRKKGTGSPSIKIPDSFPSAIPSTRLCENANNSKVIIMLETLVSRQIIIIIQTDNSVRENRFNIITETINAMPAGKISLDITYPFLPTGVTARKLDIFSSYSVSIINAEAKQNMYGVINARNKSHSR